jgi:outer membrane lipoprotein-sorting protein
VAATAMESIRKRSMRKIFYLIALLMTGTSVSVSAQSETMAKSILAEVSKKYKSYDAIKSEFSLTVNNPQAKINETQSGTLYVRSKSNKYKVILKDQEIMSDGKNQWTYLKDDNEVQLSEVDNSPNALNPARVFTIYEKGFKSLYTNDSKSNGKIYHHIELTPTDAKTPYFKVKLKIDKATKQIASAVIYDKNGSHYTYTIKSFSPNVKIADSTFAFDAKKHPGVEVVDLR